MESFGINSIEETKKTSILKGLVAFFIEMGVVFILVVNVIFVLNYFKIIELRILIGG